MHLHTALRKGSPEISILSLLQQTNDSNEHKIFRKENITLDPQANYIFICLKPLSNIEKLVFAVLKLLWR